MNINSLSGQYREDDNKNIKDSGYKKSEREENFLKFGNDLYPEDVEFIRENSAGNQYYDEDGYTQNYLYLKNLKTPSGEAILEPEQIKIMLESHPKSEDMMYMGASISLIQDGVLEPEAVANFEKDADFNKNTTFSDNYKRDMRKYYSIASQYKDSPNLQEKIKDAYIPDVKSDSEGLKTSNIGDAYQVSGEKYIRIKSSESQSSQMNISKDTYNKLFPMVERFATKQGQTGDCYLIEPLTLLYSDPKERANIVSMFSEDDKGNVLVNIPNSDVVVSFKNGQLPQNEPTSNFSTGADGFKLLEYAYGVSVKYDMLDMASSDLSGSELAKFSNFLQQNGANTFVMKDVFGKVSYTTFNDAKAKGYLDDYNQYFNKKNINEVDTYVSYLTGNGGVAPAVFDKLNYNSYTTQDKQVMINNLKNPNFFNNNMAFIGAFDHQYSISQNVDENGTKTYYLNNPYGQANPIEYTLDGLINVIKTEPIIDMDVVQRKS